jgi:hypothetical protein
LAAPLAEAAENPDVSPGDVVISEFRFHGPNGANDEFFELFNTTNDKVLDLNSDDDNSLFWLAYYNDTVGQPGFVQLKAPLSGSAQAGGTQQEFGPRQHFLFTNKTGASSYSLDAYDRGDVETDVSGLGDVDHDGGIALIYDPDIFDSESGFVVDAVGFPGGNGGGFESWEGMPEPAIEALTTQQYSHFRRYAGTGGKSLDSGNNATDFDFVVNKKLTAVSPSYAGQPAIQGAPGPESRSAPLIENDGATPQLNDGLYSSLVSGTSASAFPNREYVAPSTSNGNVGSLTIRRRVTNRTGKPLTRLRFRISQLTTYGTATSSQALLRALDANTASLAGGEAALGAKTEEPPDQPDGGGLNTSMVVNLAEDASLPSGVLPNGGDVVVTFRFAVDRGGSFQFSYNAEAS